MKNDVIRKKHTLYTMRIEVRIQIKKVRSDNTKQASLCSDCARARQACSHITQITLYWVDVQAAAKREACAALNNIEYTNTYKLDSSTRFFLRCCLTVDTVQCYVSSFFGDRLIELIIQFRKAPIVYFIFVANMKFKLRFHSYTNSHLSF